MLKYLRVILYSTLTASVIAFVTVLSIVQLDLNYDYRMSGVKVSGTSGHGSGVVVDSNDTKSLVLTNKHVCDGITYDINIINKMQIERQILFFSQLTGNREAYDKALKRLLELEKLLNNSRSKNVVVKMNISKAEFKGLILKTYEKHDLCLVELPVGRLPVVKFSTQPYIPGQRVITFGNPLDMENHFTEGFIGDSFVFQGKVFIHHTATIHPGNSGSGAYDLDGNLVGINTISNPQVVTQSGMVAMEYILDFLEGNLLKD